MEQLQPKEKHAIGTGDHIPTITFGAPLTPVYNPPQRRVKTVGFSIVGLLLMICGASLILLSLRIYADRIPYLSLICKDAYYTVALFKLMTGMLCLLCAVLMCLSKYRSSLHIQSTLLVLLALAVMTLSIEITAGLMFRYKMEFGLGSGRPLLLPGTLRNALNETLSLALRQFDKNDDYRCAWDRTQKFLRCCGVDGPDDWRAVQEYLPVSCCCSSECKQVIGFGCLNAIAWDMAWETMYFIGTGFMIILILVLAFGSVAYSYIQNKPLYRNLSM